MLSDHVVWFACLAFYLADCVRFLKPEYLLLEEGRRHAWTPVLPFMPSQPVNRTIGFLDLLQPWRAVISVSWLRAFGRPVGPLRTQIRARLRKFEAFRLVSQLEFFLLFLFGPLTTFRWGLANALLAVLAAHLSLSAIILVAAILRVRSSDMTVGSGFGLWFECLVCPGCQANVFRRALLRQGPIEADAFALLRNGTAKERYALRLIYYAEELNEHGFVDQRQLDACRALAGNGAG